MGSIQELSAKEGLLAVVAQQVLETKASHKEHGNIGMMTPGKIAELACIKLEMYQGCGKAWQGALQSRITRTSRSSDPFGHKARLTKRMAMISGTLSSTTCTEQTLSGHTKGHCVTSMSRRVNSLPNLWLSAIHDVAEAPAISGLPAADGVPEVFSGDLQRGNQVQNKLKRLGEALGKATGMSLMGTVPEAANAVIQKVQKHFLKVRVAQPDSYPKDEFKVVSTSLEDLMDELVTAVPSLSGLQKIGSKSRHDEMAPDPAMPLEDGSCNWYLKWLLG